MRAPRRAHLRIQQMPVPIDENAASESVHRELDRRLGRGGIARDESRDSGRARISTALRVAGVSGFRRMARCDNCQNESTVAVDVHWRHGSIQWLGGKIWPVISVHRFESLGEIYAIPDRVVGVRTCEVWLSLTIERVHDLFHNRLQVR